MESYREQLLKQDWGILLEKLTYITVTLARVKDNQIISEGKTAKDIAAEAMEKTLSGERQWNPGKCPNILAHLAGSAKSIIWNLRNKKETQITESFFVGDQEIEDLIDQVESEEKGPLDNLIEQSNWETLNQGINEALADIPFGPSFFELLSMHKPTPEIAVQLGISIPEVYNMKRLIKRRMQNFLLKEGPYEK